MDEAEAQLCLVPEAEYAENVIHVGNVIFGLDANRRIKYSETKLWEQNKKEQSANSNKDLEKELKDLEKELNEKLEHQVDNLTRAACALLNSGGGVIRAEIANDKYLRKKYLHERDGIGTKIENSFRKLIQDRTSGWYFDFKQKGSCMLIFVKTWTSENSAFSRLCSLTTGLYVRSESCAVETKPKNFVELFQMKKGVAKRGSVEEERSEPKKARLSADSEGNGSQDSMEGKEDVRGAAATFLRQDNMLEFEETLDFAESNTVEFKAFPINEDSLAFVSRKLPCYASAFANTEGGYLFFGVDNSRKVTGCRSSVDPVQMEEAVGAIIESLPRYSFHPHENKIIIEFKALPVQDRDGNSHGYVFAVRFEPFSGVVFRSVPDSWIVEADRVTRLTVPRWIELMAAEDPDLSKLADNFMRVLSLSDGPPMIKTVYSMSDLNRLRKSLFPANSDRVAFIPPALCEQLFQDYPNLKDLMEREVRPSVQGTLMFSQSWAVDLGLPKNPAIVCDALLIAAGRHISLFTVIKDPAAAVSEHARRTAKQLKHKLVNVGGYSQKIGVLSRILCLSDGAISEKVFYPGNYRLQEEHLPAIQRSAVIVLLSFRSSLSDFLGVQFLNLLTLKQYKKLSNPRETPLQFIYGVPGSGKTVLALKMLEKIQNEFNCGSDGILYICENSPLRDYVRMRRYNAVTRTSFMKGSFPHVQHIVVDEAQNFRMEDGSWYEQANNILQRHHSPSGDPGVFWIFLDYFQMSHPYETGLPPQTQQYPRKYLTTAVRNATNIYQVVKDEMGRIVENKVLQIPHQVLRKLLQESECGNTTPGVCEISTNKSMLESARYVATECRRYLDRGYSRKDIAILCSTGEIANCFKGLLTREMRRVRLDLHFVTANEVLSDQIVLDSIRRFSGLERPIVFGINPICAQAEVFHNLLLCLASRAHLHLHVLFEDNGPAWASCGRSQSLLPGR